MRSLEANRVAGFIRTDTVKLSVADFEDEQHEGLECDRTVRHAVSRTPKLGSQDLPARTLT